MNRNIIALAVAGVLASPALAQSNVSIYGIVDMGYAWRGDNVRDGVGSRSALESGLASGSRLGFRGREELGNGLEAGFVLEQGLLTDTGLAAQGGRSFGRQSYVSLSGSFGSVALGRQYAPGYLLTAEVDPFGSGTVGQYNNVYLTEYRWDNQISYASPSWRGFSVVAALTPNAYGNESPANRGEGELGDLPSWSVVPQYRRGALFVGLNVQRMRAKSRGLFDGEDVRVYDLAASYDVGAVKFGVAYGLRRAGLGDFSPDTGAREGADSRQWMLGVTVPVGAAGKLLASWTERRTEVAAGGADAAARQWALGYEHGLSKRTSLYAAYADIDNNRAARAAATLQAAVGDASRGGDGYQRGVSLGIRHAF